MGKILNEFETPESFSIFDRIEKLSYKAHKFELAPTKIKYKNISSQILYSFRANLLKEKFYPKLAQFYLTQKKLFQTEVN